MSVDYLQELRNARAILSGAGEQKEAEEQKTAFDDQEVAGPSTKDCEALSEELMKFAAEIREEEAPTKAPDEEASETSSAIGDATGVSKEEVKRKLLAMAKKKKEQKSEPEKGESAGEGAENEAVSEEKAAAGGTPHYADLPGKTSPDPPDVAKLLSEAPPEDISPEDLKKGLLAFAKSKKSEKGEKESKKEKGGAK